MTSLNDYFDTPAVLIFERFAGEGFDNVSTSDLWDIAIVLAQATLIAEPKLDGIAIQDAIERSTTKPSPKALLCLDGLNGCPSNQVRQLVTVLLRTLQSVCERGAT